MSDEENKADGDARRACTHFPPRDSRLRDDEVAAAVSCLPGTELYEHLKHDLALWRRQGRIYVEGERIARVIAAQMCRGGEEEQAITEGLMIAMLCECKHKCHAHRWVDGFIDGEQDGSGKSFETLLRRVYRKDRQGGRDRGRDAKQLAGRHPQDIEHFFDAYSCREEDSPDRRLHLRQQFTRSLDSLKRHRKFKPVHECVIEAIVEGHDLAGVARYIRRSPASVTRYMHQIHSMLRPCHLRPNGDLRAARKRRPR